MSRSDGYLPALTLDKGSVPFVQNVTHEKKLFFGWDENLFPETGVTFYHRAVLF